MDIQLTRENEPQNERRHNTRNNTKTLEMMSIQEEMNKESPPNIILFEESELDTRSSDNNTQQGIVGNVNIDIHLPYQICISQKTFDNVIKLEIRITGTHDTMGMNVEENK